MPRSDNAQQRYNASRTAARLPNKTQWTFLEIISAGDEAQKRCNEIRQWIKGQQAEAKLKFDTRRIAELVELLELVTEIEQIVAWIQTNGIAGKHGEDLGHRYYDIDKPGPAE